MLLPKLLIASLLLAGLVGGEEQVDVVEAVPAQVEEQHAAQDREDTEGSPLPDQLALETVDKEGGKHPDHYKGSGPDYVPPPPRHSGHPLAIPVRNNGPLVLPPHVHGKPPGFGPHGKPPGPVFDHGHDHYHGPPPPPPRDGKPHHQPPQRDGAGENLKAQGTQHIAHVYDAPPLIHDKLHLPHDGGDFNILPPSGPTGPVPGFSLGSLGAGDPWPAPMPDMPKIISLDVKCEKNLMKVYVGFDKPFYGIIFSKGHYSNVNCVHLPAGLGRTSANFDISIHSCGTTGNTENGLYGYGADSGSGTYFENIIVIQYDPQVQEVWDQARKLRCTWHDQYEKSVTFRPFPVDMLDVVRADFAGDNVGCWMQIQVGKGPWASEVSGLVKIGQTMTMVLAIKDDDNKFDMLVRNCMAHDGKRAPIQLVDQKGCVTRPKLMSRFTKIKNFGASASVLSYAHFQAFKFPDSMEVHFQCTIQICRYQCPEQCSDPIIHLDSHLKEAYGPPLDAYQQAGRPRDERRVRRAVAQEEDVEPEDPEQEVGLNKIIRVVSTGDLTFALENTRDNTTTMVFPAKSEDPGLICMTTPGFAATLVVLLAILIISCLLSAFLCVRLRPFSGDKSLVSTINNPAFSQKNKTRF